jgi:hypothetical protein
MGLKAPASVLPSPTLKVAVKFAEILNNVCAEIRLELFVKEQLGATQSVFNSYDAATFGISPMVDRAIVLW